MATQGFVSWDVFLPKILQYCHAAPSIQVRLQIVDTIVEFCERSLVLKKEPSEFSYDEDVALYTLNYGGDRYRAISIDELRIGDDTNQPLSETSEKELDGSHSNWRVQTSNKPRNYFLTENLNEVRLFPMPSQDSEDDDDVYVRTRVTYKRDQVEFDEMIYERWHEAVISGSLASLLMIKGSTWYDPQLAGAHLESYRRLLRNARSASIRGTGQYPTRVIPQNYDIMGSDYKRRGGASWE